VPFPLLLPAFEFGSSHGTDVEITGPVFGGEAQELYLALLKERCGRDGLGTSDEVLARQFRLHLHRGINYLATPRVSAGVCANAAWGQGLKWDSVFSYRKLDPPKVRTGVRMTPKWNAILKIWHPGRERALNPLVY
jgi:hypothetical protein